MPQELLYTSDGKPYFAKKAANGFGAALLIIAVALMLLGAVLFIVGLTEYQGNADPLTALASLAPSALHQVVGGIIFGAGFNALLFFLTAEAIRR